LTGTITDVNLRLLGFTHTFTHDVDVLLVGPGDAQKSIVMADSGQTAGNVDLTFDDEAAAWTKTRREPAESRRPSRCRSRLPSSSPRRLSVRRSHARTRHAIRQCRLLGAGR